MPVLGIPYAGPISLRFGSSAGRAMAGPTVAAKRGLDAATQFVVGLRDKMLALCAGGHPEMPVPGLRGMLFYAVPGKPDVMWCGPHD